VTVTDVRELSIELGNQLGNAIDAFNESSEPKIELLTTRDGRTTATLPRVDRQIIVFPSSSGSVRPTAEDIAWLCEEAHRAASPTLAAAAPSLALIEAALGSLAMLEELEAGSKASES
jgi:hypothetical protein